MKKFGAKYSTILWKMLLTFSFALIVSCERESSPSVIPVHVISDPVIPIPIVNCGDGIAAIDLSGQCRAQPNPTPGALETIDRSSVDP